MTYFIAILAVLSVLAVVGLVRAIHGDRPRQAPRGPSYWSGNLPSGPFSTAR
jgi:hypothetical protein